MGSRYRFFVRDHQNAVDDFSVQNVGNKSGANALDFVPARLSSRQYRRIGRLDGKELHLLNLLFDDFTEPRRRPSRPDSNDERVKLVANHVENFTSSGIAMGRWI